MKFCEEIPGRSVGSAGNIQATDYFYKTVCSLGWKAEVQEFKAIDWKSSGAVLRSGKIEMDVKPSPYSLGCNVKAELVSAKTVEELERLNAEGKVIFLYGEIVKEQLAPKNFVFYNPDEHKRIVELLENSGAKAIITATGHNGNFAGGEYPFPFIEDGDFNIPSVFIKDVEGEKIKPMIGQIVELMSDAERIPGKGCNVVAFKGTGKKKKIVLTAHIDAKKGSPGAIDNATGVIILLLLAELLNDYKNDYNMELVALNGEDYYGVPGQMEYIKRRDGNFADTLLDINIDGAGYYLGNSSFSLFNLPNELYDKAQKIINSSAGISEADPWPQGDHSIFVQYGVPAIAVSSKWLVDNMNSQQLTHTPNDNPGIVDTTKLVELAIAIRQFIESI